MFIVLGKPKCPSCEKAKELLNKSELDYIYIDITQPTMVHWKEYIKKKGLTTVPQVFELLPGGYENLYAEIEMRFT